jgi:hypothetical protein
VAAGGPTGLSGKVRKWVIYSEIKRKEFCQELTVAEQEMDVGVGLGGTLNMILNDQEIQNSGLFVQ